MRTFIERWYSRVDAEDVTVDIFYCELRARFEACAGSIVLFESTALVDVLRWCMSAQSGTPNISLIGDDARTEEPIGLDLSATSDDPIIER